MPAMFTLIFIILAGLAWVITMVGYILTDYSEYPFAKDGWTAHYKKDYCSRIIYGYLEKTAFFRKLHASFNMVSIPLSSLPEHAGWSFFGCDKTENYHGSGRDPAQYESTAWLIKKDNKSSLFYRYLKEKHIITNKSALYPLPLDSNLDIFVICSKADGGVTSNIDLVSAFLTWYRGFVEETIFDSAYDQLYLGALHFMLRELSDVFGKNKYLRIVTYSPKRHLCESCRSHSKDL